MLDVGGTVEARPFDRVVAVEIRWLRFEVRGANVRRNICPHGRMPCTWWPSGCHGRTPDLDLSLDTDAQVAGDGSDAPPGSKPGLSRTLVLERSSATHHR